jgi:hypothetical protein
MKKILFILIFSISYSQQSRIELKSHYSPTLGITKQYNILFPEGYDSETDHYPVVYLFRGAVDEWADPMEDASRRGNIKTVYDTLYARGRVGKMILIMPGLSAPATSNEYQYVINDLLPAIDSLYRTIPTRWHRAMDGFSLGGLIVTNLMAAAPQFFCSVGSYDGTLSLFSNTLFSNASPSLIYALKQMQLLYHTASTGGNNNSNNVATFSILNSKGVFNSFPSFVLDPGSSHNWFYADWHMGITLPLHWEKMTGAENSLAAHFEAQFNTQKQNGTIIPLWQRNASAQKNITMLFASSNNGRSWHRLMRTEDSVMQYSWNTTLFPDGTLYRLKVICASDTLFGHDTMEMFTLDNPGNGTPDIVFQPMPVTLRGSGEIAYFAADADGDPLHLSLHISFNDGLTWQQLDSSMTNTGSYSVDFSLMPNSNAVRFLMYCSDGSVSTSALSARHIIANKRFVLAGAKVEHTTGISDAHITVTTNDPSKIIQAEYDIVVNESNGNKSYSVINALGTEVVNDAVELDGITEGPLFDGMRLLIKDYPAPQINNDSTVWSTGTSPLIGHTSLIDVFMENDIIRAIPLPYDYEIRISDSIVDTTLGLYGTDPQPIPFLVWNTTLNRTTKVVFVEIDMNGKISRNDEVFLIEKDTAQNDRLSWHVQFIGNDGDPNPLPGDIFRIRVLKPLTAADSYRLYAIPTSVPVHAIPAAFSLQQNFPNPFNPVTTVRFSVPWFSDTELKVFDLLGRTVAELVNEKLSAGVYESSWNAAGHASGVYFYRLRSGQHTAIKKMILLR